MLDPVEEGGAARRRRACRSSTGRATSSACAAPQFIRSARVSIRRPPSWSSLTYVHGAPYVLMPTMRRTLVSAGRTLPGVVEPERHARARAPARASP